MKLIGLRLSVGFVLALFALPGSSEAPVVLEVGTIGAENEGGWLQEEISAFQRLHPEIIFRTFDVAFPERYHRAIEETDYLALNVLGVNSERGDELAYLVAQDRLLPLDDLVADPTFNREAFPPNMWDAVTYKGHVWGVPFSVKHNVMLCYWPAFEAAGITEPPRTWEELLEVAEKLTVDKDGDGNVDQWGVRLGLRGFNRYMHHLWFTMVLQQGGYIMKDGRFVTDHPALKQSYDYLRTLEESGYAKHDDTNFKRMMEANLHRAYAIQFVPMHHLIRTGGQKELRLAPWPTSGAEVLEDSMRKYLVIGRGTQAQEAASRELVKWLLRPDVRLPTNIRDFSSPSRLDVVARGDYLSRTQSYTQNFHVVHDTMGWPVSFLQPVSGRSDALERFEVIVSDLFLGKFGFDEAMRKIETECNAILREAPAHAEPLALYR